MSWLRRLGDSLTLLTVGTEVYSGDQRYTATFTSPRNWNLVLEAVNQTDEGYYECQVTSHPPIVRSIYLHVVGKFLTFFGNFLIFLLDVYIIFYSTLFHFIQINVLQ